MQCTVCSRSSSVWYCSHCINTSPKLLLRNRLELLCINEELKQMDESVSTTLDKAIGNKEGILGKHMNKLESLQNKRHNAKIVHRISEMDHYLQEKRNRRDELRARCNASSNSVPRQRSSADTKEHQELSQKHEQLKSILAANSSLKFQELCQWFIIGKRHNALDSDNLPYSIRFIPMCNIRNLHFLSSSREALQHMWEFIVLAGQVLLVDIPYNSRYSEHPDDPLVTISQLISNLVLLLLQFRLIPQPPDLEDFLSRYDIDHMLYALCTNVELESKSGAEIPSYGKVYQIVHDIEEQSKQTEDRCNWMLLN